MEYVPFITDPRHLAALAGSSWLALRPTGDVVTAYETVQAQFRQFLRDDPTVSFPMPHVSLIGFRNEANDLTVATVRTWAAQQPRLTLTVEKLDGFPPPFQTLVLAMRAMRTCRQ